MPAGFPDFIIFGTPPGPNNQDFAVEISIKMGIRNNDYKEVFKRLKQNPSIAGRLDCSAPESASLIKIDGINYTWHHHQDGKTMMLVRTDVHTGLSHSGGVSIAQNSLEGMFASPY